MDRAAVAKDSQPGKRDSVSKLSVIVPTLNEERHVGALLSDVAAQTREPDEVLVVDAGSTDGTVRVVRCFPSVKLLAGTPPVACGRNLGGRSATGDVLIFLDADVRLHSDFFERFPGDWTAENHPECLRRGFAPGGRELSLAPLQVSGHA